MEDINSIIYDYIHIVSLSFKTKDKDLFIYWLKRQFDEAVENCTAYVNMQGWDSDNITEYKYFHTDKLKDVVKRRFEKIANNFLIALGDK